VEASEFMERVRDLLTTAPAVHADETPAQAAGGTGTYTWPAPRAVRPDLPAHRQASPELPEVEEQQLLTDLRPRPDRMPHGRSCRGGVLADRSRLLSRLRQDRGEIGWR
jgi:hypothetical protein